MPLEAPLEPASALVAQLNERFKHHSAGDVLAHALQDPLIGQPAVVSSFGAESVVLLHLLATLDKSVPVLFLDTEMLFPETLAYQKDLTRFLGLTDVRRVKPDREELFAQDPDGILHLADPDACCALRKTRPLNRALQGFEAWVTGRKRFQSASRANLEFFELDAQNRIKINPLAHWTSQDVTDYITNNRLPRHPLVSGRLPSLGCMPCTAEIDATDDLRSGRWKGQAKTECGIHLSPPAAVQAPAATGQVVVTDQGFGPDYWDQANGRETRDLASDVDPSTVDFTDVQKIRIDFPTFADGRGFTIARQLRLAGFSGVLRARGHVIADQYAMARRSGFDEVEISPELARRQPESDWVFRANWRAHDYQSRLRG